MADWLVKLLIVEYAVIALASWQQPWKALYWIGAMLISVAVLKLR